MTWLTTYLDMAMVELRVVSKTSCTGYDKSNDKTESCKKQSVAQRLCYLELVKFMTILTGQPVPSQFTK